MPAPKSKKTAAKNKAVKANTSLHTKTAVGKNAPVDGEKEAQRRIEAWINKPNKASKSYQLQYGANTSPLNLGRLGLKKLPDTIRKLQGLEVLIVRSNALTKIPEWVGQLTELKYLTFTGNRLTEIPDFISGLTKLKFLGWGGNNLREVPDSIGALTSLRNMNLSDNKLEYIPVTLKNVPLKSISLSRNYGLGVPHSIIDRRNGLPALRYYFETLAGNSQPLQELKLLLVGRGKAGKTSLIKRLADEQPDEQESETHSISIRPIEFDCPKGKVKSRVWDFGGQEILHSTHQFFLTERSLYLLVLEPRTGNAQRDAEYWLKLIETQGKGSPVIVALNYSHNRIWQVDQVKLKRKFPFIVNFVSTDAMYGDGLHELKQLIINTVNNNMPDVWFRFPDHWRIIKDTVAGMKDNFLTYRQYSALCKKLGERRPEAQAALAEILHWLGLALYFGNDPRLHDTRVLNPGWVTGGVYAVIRSNMVEQKDGQLALADMPEVLCEAEEKKVIKTADYPKTTHRFILELMKAFQLCYANSDTDGKRVRFLVPELLPEFEPKMNEAWDKAPVRLRYKYEILSPGLLSRFIVQTHGLSENEPHWRHGVVLKHADAKALIREEADRNELQVFITGLDEDARMALVAMVRRELELLNEDMKNQPAEEMELSGDTQQWISVKALREVERPMLPKMRLPVQPDGTAEINVPFELNKLIPAKVRTIDRKKNNKTIPVKVFVSYSHQDEKQLKRLDCILDVLEQQHGLTSWNDKRLLTGDYWDKEIRARLEDMDIFLFIASQHSLVSKYIRDVEIKRALTRKRKGEVEIATVKLEACACDEDAHLGKLQRLARNYRSVSETNPRSTVWEQVRRDLLPVIDKVRQRKSKGR
jgi:internalin A